MEFKILRTGSLLNCTYDTINRFPYFYNKDLTSITKSKNGFAVYPSIPRTGSHELVRTLNPITACNHIAYCIFFCL